MSGRGRPRKPRPVRANGAGSIRELKADELYELRPPRIGGESHKTKRFRGTRAQALKALDDYVRELGANPYTDELPTLAEWAQRYLDDYSATQHSVANQANTRFVVEHRIIADPIGEVRLDQLKREHIQRWIGGMVREGLRLNTIRGYRRPLHTMLAIAVRDGMIPRNPVSDAILPSQRVLPAGREVNVLDLDQARRFIAWCQREDEPWGPFFIVSALLGLRPGEACALHWGDFDDAAGTVRIHSALERVKDKPHRIGYIKIDHGGGDGARTVAVPDDVVLALKQWSEYAEGYADTFRPDPRWSDVIFLWNGKPPYQSSIRKALDTLVARINAAGEGEPLPRLTPYSLRHSCASILLDQGVSWDEVARMLGTSETMLREHYRHLYDPVTRSAADVWNRARVS